jgi:3-phenylpropionate/trans-cinnamate dioxygenase ferredoxin subunit
MGPSLDRAEITLTGRDPKRFRARAYPVNVEPGSAVVKGPYVAETLAVSVESDYVVVDL